MSQDLLDQLADYGRQLRAAQTPIPRSIVTSRATTAGRQDDLDADAVRPDHEGVLMLAPDPDDRPRRRGVMLAVAAATVGVLTVGLVALAFRDTDDDGDASEVPPPTDVAAETTTAPAAEPASDAAADPVDDAAADAEAIAAAYFVGFNDGDADAVLALFAPDANFIGNEGAATAGAFEQMLHWDIAQGTLYSMSECTTTDAEPDAPAEIACSYDHFDSLMQAAATEPVSYVATLTVDDGLIVDLDKRRVAGGFAGSASTQFDTWMGQNHPDDKPAVACCGWDSVEDATARGQLPARYAQEWAASLDADN